jgi:hypothetical protein
MRATCPSQFVLHLIILIKQEEEKTITQALVPHRADSGSNPGDSTSDSWWTKWRWSRFTFKFLRITPANHHSTICSIPVYHRSLVTQGGI